MSRAPFFLRIESRSLRARILATLAPAVAGAIIGYAYARATLPPEIFVKSSLPGMYAAAGAAVLILAARLAVLLRMIWSEIRRTRSSSDNGD